MRIKAFILIGCCVLMGCNVSKNTAHTASQMQALEELVDQKKLQIRASWAYPLVTSGITSIANSGLLPPGSNVSTINLTGNNNYFRMYGDSISMYLPFFGERRLAGGYSSMDVAIKYDGKPENIDIKKNEKKQVYEIRFTAKADRDAHNVFIRLMPSLIGNITINSNYKTTISYQGDISKVPSENSNQAVTIQ